MIQEFKAFISRGNIVDIAVGFTVGAAFSAIAKSVVDDLIMPPIALLLGRVDFVNDFFVLKMGANNAAPYHTLADAKAAGAVTLNYGASINTILSFFIVAIAMFFIIRAVTAIQRKKAAEAPPPEPTTEEKLLGEIRDILRSQKRG